MELAEILAFAMKSRANELRLIVNRPIELQVGGDVRQVNLPPLQSKDFEDLVVKQLSAPAREALRMTGRCEESFKVDGLGEFRAQVERQSARFILSAQPPSAKGTSSVQAKDGVPGKVPTFSERLRGLFGRKQG